MGQRQRVVQCGRSLDEGQELFHGLPKRRQALMEAPLTFGGPDVVELATHGSKKRGAVEVLILVEVIAYPHTHRVQRRRLVSKAGDEDGDDIGIEEIEIFEQVQSIVARSE